MSLTIAKRKGPQISILGKKALRACAVPFHRVYENVKTTECALYGEGHLCFWTSMGVWCSTIIIQVGPPSVLLMSFVIDGSYKQKGCCYGTTSVR